MRISLLASDFRTQKAVHSYLNNIVIKNGPHPDSF